MANHPYEPSGHTGEDSRRACVPNVDDLLNDTVSAASGIGARMLSGIVSVLDQVGDALDQRRGREEKPSFAQWKRRLDRRLQNGKQGSALALAITGWVLAASFGVAAVTMWALAAMGPQTLGVTQQEFLVFPILMACFTPLAVGFGIMGGTGVRQYRYFGRLRGYLRVARDWVCDVSDLARDTMTRRELAGRDLMRAVASGDLPDAMLNAKADTLYLNSDLYGEEQTTPPRPAAESEPEETDLLHREGAAFLSYLMTCRGRLGADADEELAAMEKNCAAILGFVHNHPEQIQRVRRFREYYLPTTRKLLDTAQGLGDAPTGQAQEIRRDITGILHTLNMAYSKLYDTLLQDISLDVSTEIDTLETMLRQDGLTHDFESDFKSG